MFALRPDGMQPRLRARCAPAGALNGAAVARSGAQLLATIMVLIVAVAPSATSTTTM